MKGDLRQHIRKKILRQRGDLLQQFLEASAQQLLQRLKTLPECLNSQHISAYIAVRGELDPSPFMHWARKQGKTTYLPIVVEQNLRFAPVTEETPMRRGKYNIPVPEFMLSELASPEELELVLVPLVAFDISLNRLGMGGGYYDRSFAFRANNTNSPHLVGVAHEFQRVRALDAEPWDIPMDLCVTEKSVYSRAVV